MDSIVSQAIDGDEIAFGTFRFDLGRRLLWEGEARVRLGGRALAILGILVERPGQLVSKEQLFERAWPGLRVDEANLRVQISGLRKALRDDGSLIRVESALGYRFIGGPTASRRPVKVPTARFHVPRSATIPLGRDGAIADVIGLVERHRLVTILGTGGIGKTTVALAIANRIGDDFIGGECFADLSRATRDSQVYAAITDSLELPVPVEPNIEQVLLALHGRRLLLILDSAEHIADSIAQLAERVLSAANDLHILVTAREPLRVQSETVYQLGALESPPPDLRATAANIQNYASVELFTRTACQASPNFRVDDKNADTVAEVCRRLDGVPLAIDLAASIAGVLGADEVYRRLDERLSVLTLNRRSTVPRQRSLHATMDWSYSLLSDLEQLVFRRLACFFGPFSLASAIAIATDEQTTEREVREAVAALARKSLLAPNHQCTPPEYRMLETTRAYASQAPVKIADEREQTSERHARYLLALLEQKDWDSYSPVAERTKLRGTLEEIHVALDWAFSTNPDLGVKLTLAAERLWLELASLARGIHYLGLASKRVEADANADVEFRARLLVSVACAQAYIMTPGPDDASLYERAWRAAQVADDDFLQLRALYAIMHNLLRRRLPLSFYLDEFSVVASRSDDPAVQQLPLVLSAYQDVERSDILSSSQKLESFITNCPYFPRKYTSYFGHGLVIMCEVTFALIRYWLGYCDESRLMFASLVEGAEYRANSTTLCFALAHGAIWCELHSGNVERAADYLQKLEELARIYEPWQALATVYRALLTKAEYSAGSATEADLRAAEKIFGFALQTDIFLKKQAGLFPVLLFELADIRRVLGDLHGAKLILNEAMTYCMNDHDARIIGWHHPILARVLMARNRHGDMDTARRLFTRAIEVTRLRGTLYSEFEATLGLAELDIIVGRPADAELSLKSLLQRNDRCKQLPGFARACHVLDQAVSQRDSRGTQARRQNRSAQAK